jgi:hypothetical protein
VMNPMCSSDAICATCVTNTDCMVTRACYDQHCRRMCKLGGTDCASGETCKNVGHFAYGVCVP